MRLPASPASVRLPLHRRRQRAACAARSSFRAPAQAGVSASPSSGCPVTAPCHVLLTRAASDQRANSITSVSRPSGAIRGPGPRSHIPNPRPGRPAARAPSPNRRTRGPRPGRVHLSRREHRVRLHAAERRGQQKSLMPDPSEPDAPFGPGRSVAASIAMAQLAETLRPGIVRDAHITVWNNTTAPPGSISAPAGAAFPRDPSSGTIAPSPPGGTAPAPTPDRTSRPRTKRTRPAGATALRPSAASPVPDPSPPPRAPAARSAAPEARAAAQVQHPRAAAAARPAGHALDQPPGILRPPRQIMRRGALKATWEKPAGQLPSFVHLPSAMRHNLVAERHPADRKTRHDRTPQRITP